MECKQPSECAGVAQLESYFVGEPHVQLGIWANDPTPGASAIFIYRKADGRMLVKRRSVSNHPRPGEAIKPETQRLTYNDLVAPTEQLLKKCIEDLRFPKVRGREVNGVDSDQGVRRCLASARRTRPSSSSRPSR
jgi:hypothetical protein